jgi:hypothetical protein
MVLPNSFTEPRPEDGEFQPVRSTRKRWIVINLVLGGVLWFGFCTDFSWRGTLPDVLHPTLAAVVAWLSLMKEDKGADPSTRRRFIWACMPSLLGGGCALLFMAPLLLNPLALMFRMSESAAETIIQSAISPDGTRIADVYFRPVGAYAGGNGRVSVRVRYLWLPFVERDVVYIGRSYADEDTYHYLEWTDSDTLSFFGDSVPATTVGLIRFMGLRL